MNKWFAGLSVLALIAGVVYAQELGAPQVPGNRPGPLGSFQGMRANGGGSVAASDKYVYVLRGDVLYQYTAEGLKPASQVSLPASNGNRERGGGDRNGGEGGGRRDRNAQPPTVD